MYKKFFILLTLSACSCAGLNILVIFSHSGKSHFLAFEPLLQTLAKSGHNLTVISFFPQKNPIPNYRDVVLATPTDGVEALPLYELPTSRMINYMGPFLISQFADSDYPKSLENENLVKFMKEDNKFDLILLELFNTNLFFGLAKKYQAPIIGLSSCTLMPWMYDWVGNPANPAYTPVLFMDYSDELTFIERLESTLMYFYTRLIYKYRLEKPGSAMSKKYFGEDLLQNGNMVYNLSLILANTHFSLTLPRPLVPAFVEVGGLHIGTPKKPPSNIEKWIKEAPDGVIYFSLGSYIQGHTFPKEKKDAFLNAFRRLPQRILWKWENETMEGKPDNVMIQKWAPQLDVLCHPNVKAFISHGGLLGTMEAVHCGVPMILMPQFGDQFTNSRAVEKIGGGLILKIKDVTEDAVYNSLKTILSPKFMQNVKELSERFRDRPLTPTQTAIYWIEYVAKHKGAWHMKTAAVDMPFYKYYLIDVIATLLLIFLLFIYMSYLTITIVVRRILFRLRHTKIKRS